MFRDDVGDGVRLRRLLQTQANPGALGPFEERVDRRLVVSQRPVVEVGVWGAMERKVRLATAVSGVSERPELAPSDRFRYGERVASQQVDVLVAER